jgi:hypothetical protein
MVAKGEWGDYEEGKKKKEYGEFVRKASEFVNAEPAEPWRYNARGKGGHTPNNAPRALLVCLLLKIWLGKPYRDTVSFLSESTYLWPIIGLKVLPGRMDLQRAMNRLTKEYLTHLNSFIVDQGYYAKKDAGSDAASVPLIAPASR